MEKQMIMNVICLVVEITPSFVEVALEIQYMISKIQVEQIKLLKKKRKQIAKKKAKQISLIALDQEVMIEETHAGKHA